jgi:hypothetical protein
MQHFMLSIGDDSGKQLSASVQEEIEQSLRGIAFAEAFPGTYVVAVSDPEERHSLVVRFHEITTRDPSVSVLVSPLLEAGSRYDGALPGGKWEAINRRSGALALSEAEASIDA